MTAYRMPIQVTDLAPRCTPSLSLSLSPCVSRAVDRRRRHSTRFIISPRSARCNGHLGITEARRGTPRWHGADSCASFVSTGDHLALQPRYAWVSVARVRTCPFWPANCTSNDDISWWKWRALLHRGGRRGTRNASPRYNASP